MQIELLSSHCIDEIKKKTEARNAKVLAKLEFNNKSKNPKQEAEAETKSAKNHVKSEDMPVDQTIIRKNLGKKRRVAPEPAEGVDDKLAQENKETTRKQRKVAA